MKLGFTGTRQGITEFQRETLKHELSFRKSLGFEVFVWGAAQGADYEAALVASQFDYLFECHPAGKAFIPPELKKVVKWAAKPPLTRNHDIVNKSDMILAIPARMEEELRSGTWATIRYAKKTDKRIKILWPDGTTSEWNAHAVEPKSLF